MANQPRVGITGNARRWSPGWWCAALAVRLCGAKPQRISVRHPLLNGLPDALIIGGGDDISPEHYQGDLNAKVRVDPERDQLEIGWIRKALAHGIPLLGICRGAQLINVVLGGALHQDIRHLRKLTYNRPGLLPTKQVRLEPASQLAQVCGTTRLRVNSLHHQAIKVAGEELTVVGWDLDQLTQAVESSQAAPIIGVQWHPEYLLYLPSQLALFRWLVNESRGGRKKHGPEAGPQSNQTTNSSKA